MTEFASGNIYIRMMGNDRGGFATGESVSGHAHNFDHTSIFFNGRWKIKRWAKIVDANGEQRFMDGEGLWFINDEFEREGPFHLLIEAGCKHDFTYLGSSNGMPGRAWCVYSHRSPQGEVVDHWNGWSPAYQ